MNYLRATSSHDNGLALESLLFFRIRYGFLSGCFRNQFLLFPQTRSCWHLSWQTTHNSAALERVEMIRFWICVTT